MSYRHRLQTVNREVALVGMMYPDGRLQMPWPALRVPPFSETQWNGWELERHIHPGWRVRGYFTPGLQRFDENWTLSKDEVTWMSITPMELESQAHHLAAARGHVVVVGLGMGVLAWNLAQKPEVERITIIEKDPSIIEIVNALAVRHDWADVVGRRWDHRVSFINKDVFDLTINTVFDVALLDIWPMVGDERLRPDLLRIARNVRAGEYAAWGLESDFLTWLSKSNIRPSSLRQQHWREYSDSIGIQLIMRNEPQMAHLAFQAVVNGMKHEADKLMGGPGRFA